MADGSSGGIGLLGVIVGAVIVLGVGFFFLQGGLGGKSSGPSVTISAPSAPGK